VRVVLDVANGAAYKVAPSVFNELGADVILLNDTPNGSNINLNCGALHPENLGEQVRKLRADIGFAFDGDADRLVAVDENGDVVHGDKLLGALSVYLKENGKLKKNASVATVMSNQALEDYLKKNDIELYRCNVGDKYVLETFLKEDLNFGGEQSGHIILADFAKTGDALVAALAVMANVITSDKPVSELLNPFELYPQLQENLIVGKKIPLQDIDGYATLIKEIESQKIRVLIRYSGTENLLRILLEGKDEKKLNEMMEKVSKFLISKLNG
jgi:phosphoglucosamine mutase